MRDLFVNSKEKFETGLIILFLIAVPTLLLYGLLYIFPWYILLGIAILLCVVYLVGHFVVKWENKNIDK